MMKIKILNYRLIVNASLALLCIVLLSGCAESFNYESCHPDYEYGFLNGLWHGVIAPISLVVSIFKEDVSMYAYNNSGNWYNFGFLLGMIIIWGGGSNAKKSRK